jgi:hypothetical protein
MCKDFFGTSLDRRLLRRWRGMLVRYRGLLKKTARVYALFAPLTCTSCDDGCCRQGCNLPCEPPKATTPATDAAFRQT